MARNIDPVCGSPVETGLSVGSTVYEGKTYSFCSKYCMDQFTKNPSKCINLFHDEQQESAMDDQVDPVCGHSVWPASAAGTVEFSNKVFYFCSAYCLEKFKADPSRRAG